MDRLLRQSEVLAAAGFSRMHLFKLRKKAGGFPEPVDVGGGAPSVARVRRPSVDCEQMLATGTRVAPLRAKPPDQNQTPESTTTCGGCATSECLYIIGETLLCVGCIGAAVSLACTIWPDLVSYKRDFEKVLL